MKNLKKLYEAYQKLLKQFTNDDNDSNFNENNRDNNNYFNFVFFDKDMYYWLTKIFGKVMPSFIQQGYEPTGIFGPPYN